MRFQDLLDDLAEPRWEHHTITTVARRVAALYETCPDCEDGMVRWAGVPDTCVRCEGTGAEGVADKMRLLFIDPHAYLFGEE